MLASEQREPLDASPDLLVAAASANAVSATDFTDRDPNAAAAAAAYAASRVPLDAPPLLSGTPFAEAPHPAAAAMVAAELSELLRNVLKELGDWTVKTRLRSAQTLLGILWLAGPATTKHFDLLLSSFLRGVEDDDEMVS